MKKLKLLVHLLTLCRPTSRLCKVLRILAPNFGWKHPGLIFELLQLAIWLQGLILFSIHRQLSEAGMSVQRAPMLCLCNLDIMWFCFSQFLTILSIPNKVYRTGYTEQGPPKKIYWTGPTEKGLPNWPYRIGPTDEAYQTGPTNGAYRMGPADSAYQTGPTKRGLLNGAFRTGSTK